MSSNRTSGSFRRIHIYAVYQLKPPSVLSQMLF
jgi:hypothetical protein